MLAHEPKPRILKPFQERVSSQSSPFHKPHRKLFSRQKSEGRQPPKSKQKSPFGYPKPKIRSNSYLKFFQSPHAQCSSIVMRRKLTEAQTESENKRNQGRQISQPKNQPMSKSQKRLLSQISAISSSDPFSNDKYREPVYPKNLKKSFDFDTDFKIKGEAKTEARPIKQKNQNSKYLPSDQTDSIQLQKLIQQIYPQEKGNQSHSPQSKCQQMPGSVFHLDISHLSKKHITAQKKKRVKNTHSRMIKNGQTCQDYAINCGFHSNSHSRSKQNHNLSSPEKKGQSSIDELSPKTQLAKVLFKSNGSQQKTTHVNNLFAVRYQDLGIEDMHVEMVKQQQKMKSHIDH